MSDSFNRYLVRCLPVAAIFALSACVSTAPRQAAVADRTAVTASADGDAPVAAVPPAAAVTFDRALAAMNEERWQDAESEFERLVIDFPDYPGPFVNLAILYRREGRVQEAETALERALAIAPDHPAANNQLGMLLRERGEFATAETAYRRALAAEPDYALAYYNLGVLLDLYLQRSEEALSYYERYQALAPDPGPEVGLWIADLRRRLGMSPEPTQMAQEDGL